MTRSSAPVDST